MRDIARGMQDAVIIDSHCLQFSHANERVWSPTSS